ncbi:MAG: NAD-dependent epimerase [Candidatus Parvarchaeota archaeon]|nr:NAD-dependent epimerase [Candidatus Jingweiarchaeum tengchongense]
MTQNPKHSIKRTILITGAAGFIGFHLSKRLLEDGFTVVGVDNLNNYYAPSLKKARLAILLRYENFTFHKINIANRQKMQQLFGTCLPKKLYEPNNPVFFDYVIHLAAQPGVRYSITNPYAYIDSNINGFLNILEGCRHIQPKHLIFASSSSVYGLNTKMPFSVQDNVDHPISLYGATKKANELMAHTYAHLYNIPCTGLRFFTVYGPWGRPDMAYFKFAEAIMKGNPIDVYNYGKMKRDFTYVDDVVEGIVRLLDKVPKPNINWSGYKPDPSSSSAPYKIYNIGNNNPVELMYFIEVLEDCLGKKAKKIMLPLQLGDLPSTFADIEDLTNVTGFKPNTPLEVGIKNFVTWFKEYFYRSCRQTQ